MATGASGDVASSSGGSTSKEMPWPEDKARSAKGMDQMEMLEAIIQKTLKRMNKTHKTLSRHGSKDEVGVSFIGCLSDGGRPQQPGAFTTINHPKKNLTNGGLWEPDFGELAPEAQSAGRVTAQSQLRDFSVSMPRLSVQDVDTRILPQQVKAALDFLTSLNPSEVVPDDVAARLPHLLPPQMEAHSGRRTLLLDLDETLVHCHCQPTALPGSMPWPDMHLEIGGGDTMLPVVLRANIYVRPFARQLLRIAAEIFEVVIFTASAAIYADKVLDFLDPGHTLITHRLYREACTEIAGGHFKDLRRIGRPLKDCVLVDNSPLAAGLTPDNGLLVSSWFADDQNDCELEHLMEVLKKLRYVESMPAHLEQRYGFKAFLQELRASSRSPALGSLVRMSLLWSGAAVGAVTQVQR